MRQEATAYPRGYLVTVATLMLVEAVSPLEFIMVFAALPDINHEFKDPALTGWLVTAFLLVSASAAAICARLGDLFGHRRILLGALTCAGVGSLVSAFSPNLQGIIAGRAIQGIAAAILPICMGLIHDHVPREKVAFSVGLVVGAGAAGNAVGLLIGGFAVDNFPWRSIFWLNAVIGFGAALIAYLGLPAPKKGSWQIGQKLDLLGGWLFVPAITLMLLALTKGGDWGWSSVTTVGMLIVGTGGFAIWFRYEARHPVPLIDVTLLARREIAMANIIVALVAVGGLHSILILSQFVQQPVWTGVGLGLSATALGVAQIPSGIAGGMAAPFSGAICSTLGIRVGALAGLAALIAGWLGIAFANGTIALVTFHLMLISLGTAMLYSALQTLMVSAAPLGRVSEVSAMNSVSRCVFMAVGAQVITVLMAADTLSDPNNGTIYPSPASYEVAMALVVLTLAGAFAVALFLPGKATDSGKLSSSFDIKAKKELKDGDPVRCIPAGLHSCHEQAASARGG